MKRVQGEVRNIGRETTTLRSGGKVVGTRSQVTAQSYKSCRLVRSPFCHAGQFHSHCPDKHNLFVAMLPWAQQCASSRKRDAAGRAEGYA